MICTPLIHSTNPQLPPPPPQAWVMTGGESMTMPGSSKEPEPLIDPMGLLKSLVSPRGNHGEEDNAARSMWVT